MYAETTLLATELNMTEADSSPWIQENEMVGSYDTEEKRNGTLRMRS